MCRSSKTLLNVERFSALSISSYEVPIILIPFFASFGLRLFAVWPPTAVTIPVNFSNSAISSILSSVSSSKYSLSQIS